MVNESFAVRKLVQILISLAIRRCRLSGILCRLSTSLKCFCELEHPYVRISISDTGVGSSLEEFRMMDIGAPLPPRDEWDGLLSITTTSLSEKDIHHYRLNLQEIASSRLRVKRLPSTSKHLGTFSGSEVCFSTSEQNIDEFVTWVVQFIQKVLVLKAQDILADLSIEHIDNQGSKHEYFLPKTEDPFPVPASLPVSNIESMRSGLESYIMKHRGSMEIACSTRREDMKVGVGNACNSGIVANAGQVSDVAIVIAPMTASPCCLKATSQITEVLYYQEFSPSSISKSILCTLESIKWKTYGLKLKEILVDREGNAVLQWEDLHLAHIHIAIHSYSIKALPTTEGTSKRKLIRKAVKDALDNLKAQSPVLFLSSDARKIQKYAPDLSRSIASLIASSDDSVFRRECAFLLGLETKDAGNESLKLRIEEKLVEVISMNDMKTDKDLAPSLFEREPFRDEDCPEDTESNRTSTQKVGFCRRWRSWKAIKRRWRSWRLLGGGGNAVTEKVIVSVLEKKTQGPPTTK